MEYNNSSYYFVKDIFGNVKEIYSEYGTKVAEYEYDTWGNCTVIQTASDYYNIANINPFRYRGYYMDTETGYYYLQTRYYDPALRRFISSDSYDLIPTLAESGDLNLYTYCGNNPVMNIDPTGESPFTYLLGLVISSLTFAIVNVGKQLAEDLIDLVFTGAWESTWEDYVGSLVGGLAGGATFYLTGKLSAAYGVMGGVETLSTNLLTNATGKTDKSGQEILLKTVLSVGIGIYLGGKAGSEKIDLWREGLKNLSEETLKKMMLNEMVNGLRILAKMRIGAALTIGGLKTAQDWFWHFCGHGGVGY